MTKEEAIEYGREWYKAIESRGDTEQSDALTFLAWANLALQSVKTGKWIFGETMGHSWMKCSECCKSQDGQTLCFTYCPNCGAEMKGAEE